MKGIAIALATLVIGGNVALAFADIGTGVSAYGDCHKLGARQLCVTRFRQHHIRMDWGRTVITNDIRVSCPWAKPHIVETHVYPRQYLWTVHYCGSNHHFGMARN